MDWKLELVVVPVGDVDRAKAFYVDQVGFAVDVDHQAGDAFRIVQLTPRGSACSIAIGVGIGQAQPGTAQGLHLVVPDIEAAHDELTRHGVEASEPFHFVDGERHAGVHPERADYNSFLTFADPDGNGWVVQEVGRAADA